MKKNEDSELKEIEDIYDESLRINKNELDRLQESIKDKPIHRKLLFAKGGIQSSIQQYKQFMLEITAFNQKMFIKLYQFVQHSKQVRERVEHISQYQCYQTDYQKFYKKFSFDVEACETALMKLLPELEKIEILLAPLTDIPEDKATEQVVKFNHELNQKITHILQEYELFKNAYFQLLQHEKPLKKLMYLCDIQQSE